MKKRGSIINVLECMTHCNPLEMYEVANFFMRLRVGCDSMIGDGLACMRFFKRFNLQSDHPEYYEVCKPQIDEMLAKVKL